MRCAVDNVAHNVQGILQDGNRLYEAVCLMQLKCSPAAFHGIMEPSPVARVPTHPFARRGDKEAKCQILSSERCRLVDGGRVRFVIGWVQTLLRHCADPFSTFGEEGGSG